MARGIETQHGYLSGLMPDVLRDFETRAREAKYFDNPVLWAKHKLGIDLWYKQAEIAMDIARGAKKSVAVRAGHGVGKDLPLDTPIATPGGWSTIGDLRVGDYVFDERGQPTRVAAKSEVFNLPLFEVTFSDGAKLRTSAAHEWSTIDRRAAKSVRRRGPVTDWRDHWGLAKTRETAELAATLTYQNGAKLGANHIVPIAGALELPERPLVLDPYILGAWLGDGTSIRPEITLSDEKLYIIGEFARGGFTLTKMVSAEYGYTFARQGALELLRALNLIKNKHIPNDYMRASIAQRRELLRGIMDTDGFVCNGSVCGVDFMDKTLAYDTVELIRSLGTRASITRDRTYLNGRDVGPRYRIVFNPTWSPFTAGGPKDVRYQKSETYQHKAKRTMRTVVSVVPVPSVPTQCIQVEAESHLYLAGEDLVPTHNSFLSAIIACWWIDTRPIQYVFVASTAPSADQVTAILWREIRNAWSISHARYAEYLRLSGLGHDTGDLPDRPLPGRITMDNRWMDDMGNLIGQGRKPPDHAEDSFQGIHAQYVLAVGDESCGLNANMIDSLSNITSNAKSRRLLIANPTNPRSRFGEIFSNEVDDNGVRPGDAWSLHHISVLDSPNFHGGDWCDHTCIRRAEHAKLPRGLGLSPQALESLTDRSYVEEKILEYGEASPRFKARVLGEFANDGGDALFDDFVIARAKDASAWVDEGESRRSVLGIDVGRSPKGDYTYIYLATKALMRKTKNVTHEDGSSDTVVGEVGEDEGWKLRFVDKFRGVPLVDRFEIDGSRTIGQATLIHQYAIELGVSEIRIDSGGVGKGLVDGLWALQGGGYQLFEIQANGPSPDTRYWINNRAFQMDNMRKLMELGQVDIDPTDRTLITQLEDILTDHVAPHGALKIEAKEDMRKRGVKSPDAGDAAWHALANLDHLKVGLDGKMERRSPSDILDAQEKNLILSGFRDTFSW